MFAQVRKAFLHRFHVGLFQIRFGYAAVHLQRADCGYQDAGVRGQACLTAFDVEEFLRAQVSAESGFRNGKVRQTQGRAGGHDAVAAVGNVGKGAAVDDGRHMFQCLDQVRFHRILQQGRHGACRVQVFRRNRFAVIVVSDYDPFQSFF